MSSLRAFAISVYERKVLDNSSCNSFCCGVGSFFDMSLRSGRCNGFKHKWQAMVNTEILAITEIIGKGGTLSNHLLVKIARAHFNRLGLNDTHPRPCHERRNMLRIGCFGCLALLVLIGMVAVAHAERKQAWRHKQSNLPTGQMQSMRATTLRFHQADEVAGVFHDLSDFISDIRLVNQGDAQGC
jgi:hypothetical protein